MKIITTGHFSFDLTIYQGNQVNVYGFFPMRCKFIVKFERP
jgi:hypothetical protein